MYPKPQFRLQGFTLVELMITLAVLAILVGLAAPGLRNFIVSNRLASESNDVIGALGLARAEAVRRGRRVILCPVAATSGVPNTAACVNPGTGSWQGWMVFEDTDSNGAHGANEEVVRTGVFAGGSTQVLSSTGLQNDTHLIVFRPDGLAKRPASNTDVQRVALGVCDVSSTTSSNYRTISLAFGARTGLVKSHASSCIAPNDP